MIIAKRMGKRNLNLVLISLLTTVFFSLQLHAIIRPATEYKMKNPYGNSVTLKLALTKEEHTHGLSGLKTNDFKDSMGMLFVNAEMGQRRFWMPDTYFALDITFLDSNLKVIGIEKDVPAHPGMVEPPEIYKTNIYQAQYVLETKAKAPFGRKLKINDVLIFTGGTSLSEIILKTRQKL